MPDEALDQLPESVGRNLPRRAQAVCLGAFNSTREAYHPPGTWCGSAPSDAIAHPMAGDAVKNRNARKGS